MRTDYGSSSPAERIKKENEQAGFLFEILKTSIMHKKIGERFIVVRSSHYDDIENKVDNVLVDRKTGNIVCALDEVSPRSMQDENVTEKRAEIKNKNFGLATKQREYGATLEYGIDLNEGKISCKKFNHLPIFLLSLGQNYLYIGLDEFKNEKASSKNEDNLFKYFLTSLSTQITELKLDSQEYKKLPQDMRNRIESLEAFIEEKQRK